MGILVAKLRKPWSALWQELNWFDRSLYFPEKREKKKIRVLNVHYHIIYVHIYILKKVLESKTLYLVIDFHWFLFKVLQLYLNVNGVRLQNYTKSLNFTTLMSVLYIANN